MYTLETELEEVMKDKQMTHIGTLSVLPRCVDKKDVFLRETKLFFISEEGVKYRKYDGSPTDSPDYCLDLNTVEKI